MTTILNVTMVTVMQECFLTNCIATFIRNPRFVKNFFLGLCEKYPHGFNDCVLIARNKKLF